MDRLVAGSRVMEREVLCLFSLSIFIFVFSTSTSSLDIWRQGPILTIQPLGKIFSTLHTNHHQHLPGLPGWWHFTRNRFPFCSFQPWKLMGHALERAFHARKLSTLNTLKHRIPISSAFWVLAWPWRGSMICRLQHGLAIWVHSISQHSTYTLLPDLSWQCQGEEVEAVGSQLACDILWASALSVSNWPLQWATASV